MVRQHGIPRYSLKERSEEARQQELRKIEKYQELDQLVRAKVYPLCSSEYTRRSDR